MTMTYKELELESIKQRLTDIEAELARLKQATIVAANQSAIGNAQSGIQSQLGQSMSNPYLNAQNAIGNNRKA